MLMLQRIVRILAGGVDGSMETPGEVLPHQHPGDAGFLARTR